VIVDSKNMIKGIERTENAKQIVDDIRDALSKIGAHMIMIGQANHDGSAKGGTTVPHLVDVVVHLYKLQAKKKGGWESRFLEAYPDYAKSCFIVEVEKNRFGPAGQSMMFQHLKDDVIYEEIVVQPQQVQNKASVWNWLEAICKPRRNR